MLSQPNEKGGTVSASTSTQKHDDIEPMQPDDLPGDLPLIARIAGVDKTLAFAATLGGVTMYLIRWEDDPAKWNVDIKDMVKFFGEDEARKMVQLLAPGAITIPNCKNVIVAERHALIAKDRENGLSNKMIARKYNIHERMVRRIRSSALKKCNENQLELSL